MNILIIGLILVILFLWLGCKNNEGFSVTDLPSLTSLSLTSLTSTSNVLADTNAIATANYCAFIDTTSNALKIAKKDTSSSSWKVIWSSELSDPKWIGTPVTFVAATSSAPAKIMIGDQTIGSGGTTPASVGTSAKLTDSGDLVIITDASNKIVWSLVGQELETAKKKLNDYYTLSEHSDRSTALTELQKKLTNFSTYIKAVGLNLENPASAELMKAHAMLVQARHQMDFDLDELNGVANSKVVSSQNGVNSSLYVNLMATTLAVSLFLLVATR